MGRKVAAFAALALVVLAAAGLALAKTTDPLPPYLTAGSFEIGLNDRWHGTLPVRATETGYTPAHEPGGWVWAGHCGAGRETVVFTRSVELLGPPQYTDVLWNRASGGGRWDGLTAVELLANGHSVFSWTSRQPVNTARLGPRSLKAFHVGVNRLTLRATKSALPKGSTRCNRGPNAPYVALSLMLRGSFATDVRSGRFQKSLFAIGGTKKVIAARIFNDGSTAAVDGELFVYHGGQLKMEFASSELDCTKEPTPAFQLHCRFQRLAPGASKLVYIRGTYVPDAPGWDNYGTAISFTARTQTPDLDHGNDSAQANLIFCEAGSKLPQCKDAKD